MAAYRRVYDSRHLQADCQEPGSAPEPYARQSSMGYLYLLFLLNNYEQTLIFRDTWISLKHGTDSSKETSMPNTISIRPSVSTEHRLVIETDTEPQLVEW